MRSTPIIFALSAGGGLSAVPDEIASNSMTEASSSSSRDRRLSEIRQLLFPNQTKNVQISSNSNFKSNIDKNARSLSFNNVATVFLI